ncbi:MAG: hypothetical protein JJLCMIEE_00479 [Acidimicrobiales bacterium]|nr:hypothetical protein [Acidimicrobiales bacterium]
MTAHVGDVGRAGIEGLAASPGAVAECREQIAVPRGGAVAVLAAGVALSWLAIIATLLVYVLI